MHRRSLVPLCALAFATPTLQAADLPAPKAAHVILMTWDGMRPDFINAQNTPNLQALLERGTFFANNHSFWPTTTEVNGTVLATGAFAAHSTIVANREYRPDINPRGPVATEAEETVRKGDALTNGHYEAVPTVAELVRQAGQPTTVAGTKPVALLHDRAAERPATPSSTIVFAGKSIPSTLLGRITAALGPFPVYKPDLANPKPNTEGNRWTTRALLEHLWHDGVPRYTVLWLSDPDFPQHITAPGSPTALAGIHDSDTNLGLVVEELKKRGELDKTDIFIVSDHGFSTTERTVDVAKYFSEHGVSTSREFTSPPQPGQVLSVSVGGAGLLYVTGRDAAATTKIVELLQQSDFAGTIFTRDSLPGTFALSTVHIDSPYAPDVFFSFRWNDDKNTYGAPGSIVSESRTGLGMHGSFGKSDVHNTLVAGGPDIRVGYRDEFPSGNIDVAATVLHLLQINDPAGLDGRVLTEALADAPLPTEKPVTKRLETAHDITTGLILKDSHTWRQYLQTTTFAGHTYFDEGNVGE
jgi:arylsulfatase A-like enzyme